MLPNTPSPLGLRHGWLNVRTLLLAGPTVAVLTLSAVGDLSAHSRDVFTTGPQASASGPTVDSDAKEEHSVSSLTGAATYSIPVVAPPGRGGMAPALSLHYSSRGADKGGIAVGWTLPIPTIEVDTSSGRLAGTLYRAGGERLVEVDEPGVAQPGVRTFRGMHDGSWARYERVESAGDVTWRVRSTDGQVHYFGEGNAKDAPFLNHYGSEARYFISRSVDRFGNTVRYAYSRVGGLAVNGTAWDTFDVRLDRIEYTSHPDHPDHHAEVRFSYSAPEHCPGSDVPVGAAFDMRTGVRLYKGGSRLNSITTWVADGGSSFRPVRDMNLVYKDVDACNSLAGLVRVLDRVEQVGHSAEGVATAFPPITFEYGDAELAYDQPKDASGLAASLGEGDRRYRIDKPGGWATLDRTLLDFDGDGKLDILEVDAAGKVNCTFNWRRNLGAAGFAPPRTESLPKLPWKGAAPGEFEGCSLSAQFSERTTPDVFSPPLADVARGSNYDSYRFMDLDGDGQVELVTALDYDRKRYSPVADPALVAMSEYPAAGPVRCRTPNGEPVACRMRSVDPWGVAFLTEGDDTGGGTYGCGFEQCPIDIGCIDCGCSSEACSKGPNGNGVTPGYRADGAGGGPGDSWYAFAASAGGGTSSLDSAGGAVSDPAHAQMFETRGADYVLRVHGIGGITVGPIDFGATVYDDMAPGDTAPPFTDATDSPGPLATSAPLIDANEHIRLSPIPLEGVFGSGRMGAGSLAGADSWHGFVDIDGDGFVDAVFQHPIHMYFYGGTFWNGEFLVFRGDGTGNFHGKDAAGTPYRWQVPPHPDGARARISLTHSGLIDDDIRRYSEPLVQLVDFNGDGLVDYVESRERDGERKLRVFYNTGVGFENQAVLPSAAEFTGTVVSDDYEVLAQQQSKNLAEYGESGSAMKDGWSQEVLRPIDLNADGLVDMVRLPGLYREMPNPWTHLTTTEPGYDAQFYINTGDRFVNITNVPAALQQHKSAFGRITITTGDRWIVRSDALDVDGDGLLDLYPNDDSCQMTLFDQMFAVCGAGGSPAYGDTLEAPRLLTRVENGRGRVVEFSYATPQIEVTATPETSDAVVTASNAKKYKLPGRTRVVDAITVSGGPGTPTMTTTYRYHNPVTSWDELARYGFRGFERATTTAPDNARGLAMQTVEHYDFTVDPDGRLTTVETIELDSSTDAAYLRSLSDTVWQRHESFGGAVVTYHEGEQLGYTCPTEPGIAASPAGMDECRASGALARTVTSWGPVYASAGGLTLDVLAGSTVDTAPPASSSPSGTEVLIANSFVAPRTLPSRAVATSTIAVFGVFGVEGSSAEPPTYDEYLCNKGAAPEAIPAGSPVVMHVPCGVRITPARGDVQLHDRGTVRQVAVISDADKYLVLTTDVRRYEAQQAGTDVEWNDATLQGWTKTVYDSLGLGLPVETRTYVDEETVAVVRAGFDLATGMAEWVQSPEQVKGGGPGPSPCEGSPASPTLNANYLCYADIDGVVDTHLVYPVRTYNALGHSTKTVVDLGTGVPLLQTGVEQTYGVTARSEMTYDGRGRLVETRRIDDSHGFTELLVVGRATYTDPSATAVGRVRTETLLDKNPNRWIASESTFNSLGWKLEEISDPSGAATATTYHYDGVGQLASVETPTPTGTATVSFTYERDGLGRVTRFVPPLGAATAAAFTIDPASGRKVVVRSEEPGDSGPAATTRLEYDAFDRLVVVTEDVDDVAAQTLYLYDANDNLAEIVDADGIVTTLGHDFAGNRRSIERGGRTWRYDYNSDGGLTCERPPVPSPLDVPVDLVVKLPSDSDPLCEKPNNPWEIAVAYDKVGRVVRRTAGPRMLGSADFADDRARYGLGDTVYEYDAAVEQGLGQLHAVRTGVRTDGSSAARTEMAYDALARPILQTRTVDVKPWGGYSLQDARTVAVEYTASGAVARTTNADDDADPTITVNRYDDARGLPSQLLVEPSVFSAQTSLNELVSIQRHPTGVLFRRMSRVPGYQYQQWKHDDIGRVRDHFVRGFACDGCSFTVVANEQLTYWDTGDVKTLRATDLTMTLKYTYDNRHQLVRSVSTTDGGDAYEADFQYSPSGKVQRAHVRSSTTGWDVFPRNVAHVYDGTDVDGRAVDPAAVKELVDEVTGDRVGGFAYDERGNATRREVNGEVVRFVYDGDEQLVEAINETAGTREVYYYDNASQRMLSFRTSFEGDGALARQWMGATEIEYRANAGMELIAGKTVVHAALDAMPVAQIVDGDRDAPKMVYSGILGHLVAVLDDQSMRLARFYYGPFGEILHKEGPDVENQHRLFNGKELDDVTRLSYYGFRYYDRISMSWTQMDPLYRFAPDLAWDQPLRMGIYGFVMNNPLRYVDPDGRAPQVCEGAQTCDVTESDRQQADSAARDGGAGFVDAAIKTWNAGREFLGNAIGEVAGALWTGDWDAMDYNPGGAEVREVTIGGESGLDPTAVSVVIDPGDGTLVTGDAARSTWLDQKIDVLDRGNSGVKGPKAAHGPEVGTPTNCFVAGTLISTSQGLVPIEDVAVGDLVDCANIETSEWSLCEVEESISHPYRGELVVVEFDGAIVEATSKHPFWLVAGAELASRADTGPELRPTDFISGADGGVWVLARDLRVGDEVATADHRLATIQGLSYRSEELEVFNLHIATNANYAVGARAVLVHNSGGTPPGVHSRPTVAPKKAADSSFGLNKLPKEKIAGTTTSPRQHGWDTIEAIRSGNLEGRGAHPVGPPSQGWTGVTVVPNAPSSPWRAVFRTRNGELEIRMGSHDVYNNL